MLVVAHCVYMIVYYVTKYIMKSCRRKPLDWKYSVEQNVIINSNVFYDDTGIKFSPPMCVQQYMAVCTILGDDCWNGTIRKVIDFGCAELGFFHYLKKVPGVQEILEVDIDKELLKYFKFQAQPLTSDCLEKRHEPLTVHVLAGSIAQQDSRLLGTDAVVCIELIEHLYRDALEALPYTVFEYIQPRVAIFTTPNSEFNKLLLNTSGFRHGNHKFEWTREQFMNWAWDLTAKYPQYSVSFVGIGPGPRGITQYGCCSQMAVFVKEGPHGFGRVPGVLHDAEHDIVYELMDTYTYPFEMDTRTVEEKIRDKAVDLISSFGSSHMYDTENDDALIPLEMLMPVVKKWCHSIEKLREVLEDSCWRVIESRGRLCAVYSHRCWSDWLLSSDDQVDRGGVEAVAVATSSKGEHEAGESWLCAEAGEDSSSVDSCRGAAQCVDLLGKGRVRGTDSGQNARNCVVGVCDSCDYSLPVLCAQESVLDDSMLLSREDCLFGGVDLPVAAGGNSKVDRIFHCDVSCDKNSCKKHSGSTSCQLQNDFVSDNHDTSAKSCDSRSVNLDGITMPENTHLGDGGLNAENVYGTMDCGVVAKVSDVLDSALNILDFIASIKNSKAEKSEHVGWECGSEFVDVKVFNLLGDSVEQKIIVDSGAICSDSRLRFVPPVYVQRYMAVCKILEDDYWNGGIRKVIDFGCAELGFFQYLKKVPGVQEILEVDIDKELLKRNMCRTMPLTSDYLKQRYEPLIVHVLAGSIAQQDSKLRGTDAVVCIELIEHLYPDTLAALPYTIFNYIQPKLAIFTTPNSEFNVLLPNFSGFRHDDHKFEWTRKQFMSWAWDLTARYPEYSVSFVGVGPGPDGTSQYGCCSQMAVFVKEGPYLSEDVHNMDPDIQYENVYELMVTRTFPFEVDTRTVEEKMRDEVAYHISSYGSSNEYDMEDGDAHIPLKVLMPTVKKWCDSIDKLREVLEDSCWKVVESCGQLCVVYTHRRWNDWLTSDDQDSSDDQDDGDDVEKEAAASALCEQKSVYSTQLPKDEEDWGPSHVDECWDLFDSVPAGQSEDGLGATGSSVVDRPERDYSSSCIGNKEEGTSCEEVVSGRSVLDTSDCRMLHREKECLVGQAISPLAAEINGKSDSTFQSDISSDNKIEQCSNTNVEDLNNHATNADSDTINPLPDAHVVAENPCLAGDRLIMNNVKNAVNCSLVAQVSDVMQTEAHISNSLVLVKSCVAKKIENGDRECSSPASVDGCIQNKRLSRNLEVTVEEGSVVDSYSLEEQNDKAVDSGYPNSADMDLDLTPEQVDEISMENDVLLTENSHFNDDSDASLSGSEAEPEQPVLHLPGEILRDVRVEGMENGDVANNNRDEEGNNAAAAPRVQVEDAAVIDFAVMQDLENENELANVDPFPNWLLHLLGLADVGDHDAVEQSSDDDDDDDVSSMSVHGLEQAPSTSSLQRAVEDMPVH